jgi:peptidase E
MTGCVVWVSGGNTFVLRQAFGLSGFDEMLLASVARGMPFRTLRDGEVIIAELT